VIADPAPQKDGRALDTNLPDGPVAVVGGSGFIGSNLAARLLEGGREIVVIDNLSRPGVEANLGWLRQRFGGRVRVVVADVRDAELMRSSLSDAAAVFHLAAQTAVTTSLQDPVADFEINARGALNVLEAVRGSGRRVPVIFSSTNKVYGNLEDLPLRSLNDRYEPEDEGTRAHGIGESRPLQFCTPYGCSKGVADQYVLDYAKSFGIPTAVLRMSCIYGPRQFGTEDQGWVAHFLIRALSGQKVTLYGDGRQVRDVLHVSDAVDAYCRLLQQIEGLHGRVFNLGGGSANAVSLNEVLREIGTVAGHEVPVERGPWRQGDQLWFVADTRGLSQETGWQARLGWREGLRDLARWLREEAGAGRGSIEDRLIERLTA
jgi:CDP-paratose 2-epimerase